MSKRGRAAAAAITAAFAIGCSASAPQAINGLAPGETLRLEGKWAEAIDALKHYLLTKPDDAGAHLYLAECYRNLPVPWFVVAEEELRLALRLFEAQGRKSSIKRFPDDYFEMRCHLELAKVGLQQLEFLIEREAPPNVLAPYLEKCEQSAARVREIAPDSKDMRYLDAAIENAKRQIRFLRRRRQDLRSRAGSSGVEARRAP